MAEAGEVAELDTTSLSSLTAGNVAATGAISQLLSEKEFGSQFHEGERAHVHITLIAKAILLVLFDERSSLGLVRLRVRKAAEEMNRQFEAMSNRKKEDRGPSVLDDISDSDIDNLFND